MGSGVGLDGWLRWLAHPLCGALYMRSTLLLILTPQKRQLCFGSFCILLFIICPNCTCMQLFLVPSNFFVFCYLRKCLSTCKHCSKCFQVPGPSLSLLFISLSLSSPCKPYESRNPKLLILVIPGIAQYLIMVGVQFDFLNFGFKISAICLRV